ncbi:MAG: [citrate (pro-3S)-lyase] ligase [Clostridium sp.]|nr:[citrate (pro-3S)-lyase] ligase [Clostridium sp.]
MEEMNLKQLVVGKYDYENLKNIKSFLKKQDLRLDNNAQYITALVDKGNIVATGAFEDKVLKCIAVDDKYKGMGLSNKIVSNLVSEEYARGNTDLFVFTKPKNYEVFNNMGFYKIDEVKDKVVLLENDPNGIKKYLEKLKDKKQDGKIISSVVLNCNPFTLGHKYLVEKASLESDILHIFVVSEDKSLFPFKVRYSLVKEGTKHLKNIILHKSGNYMISNATFPTYFIKEKSEAVKIHTVLDLDIFGKYIASTLGINKRFVGEEIKDEVTNVYNTTMKKLLPGFGVEVVEIARLRVNGEEVTASQVRKLLMEGKMIDVKKLVPEVTYDFLSSDYGKEIIKGIQIKNKI